MQLKRNQGLNMFNLDFILFHRGYTCLTRNPVVLLPRPLRGRVGVRVKWCNLKQVGVARHQVTFYCLVLAESNQSKRQPLPWPATPCATQLIRWLWNSLCSNRPRRKLLTCLRCSAWQQGIENPLITIVMLSNAKNPVFVGWAIIAHAVDYCKAS